ncbi:MAG TPA: CesT family type III secretion system chaperone [Acetobacteraceae bacterium]|jgi:hypothetical protein
MLERTRALYAELAAALGVDELPADDNGGVQLTIGDDITVVLFAEFDRTLLIVLPLAALPEQAGYTLAFWLLRQNLYTSDIAPFTLACDAAGTLVLWGRMPVSELTGATLAGLIDAVAVEARRIRGEIEAA